MFTVQPVRSFSSAETKPPVGTSGGPAPASKPRPELFTLDATARAVAWVSLFAVVDSFRFGLGIHSGAAIDDVRWVREVTRGGRGETGRGRHQLRQVRRPRTFAMV